MPERPAEEALPKLPQLDGLRALAVSTVLFHHFAPEDSAIKEVLPWGWLGVKLFFVISGFLITGILLYCRDLVDAGRQSTRYSLRHFYTRRGLRILPLYYASLLAAAALDLYPVRATLPWTLTFTTNFYFATLGSWSGAINHLWSLAVEEQFYFVWPWIILFAPRHQLEKILLGTIAGAVIFRIGGVALGYPPISILVWPFACLDTLGMGSLLAVARHASLGGRDPQALERLTRVCLRLGAPLLVGVMLLFQLKLALGLRTVASDFAMALFFTWVVSRGASGFGGWTGRLLSFGPIQHMGKISYGIYVFHLYLWAWVPGLARELGLRFPADRATAGAVIAVLTLVAAFLSWELFEHPVNSLKRHYPYAARRRSPAG